MIHHWSNLSTLQILPNGTSKCVHVLVPGHGRLATLDWVHFLRIHPFRHHLKQVQLVLLNNKRSVGRDIGFSKNCSPGMTGLSQCHSTEKMTGATCQL